MIAAKAMDPVLGVDIHIIQPPGPVPPVPVPHPFIGMLIDPMDFAPVIGATVMVNGMPRATAGTGGKCVPPHIPIGGVFVKPPGNECEVFMGSATVLADGDPLGRLGMPALSCHDVGMPPPPRLKKKRKPKSLTLPTSVVLSVPAGAPVLVGGPPTISMMALGMKAGMAGLGKAFKKLSKTKLGKKIRKKFKRKAKAQNTNCGKPGEPIDQVTGEVVNEFVDYLHPEGPVLAWTRFYNSGWNLREGPLGPGWSHGFQHELRLLPTHAEYIAPDGREYVFERAAGSRAYAGTDAGYVLSQRDDETTLVLAHPDEGEMVFRRAHPLDSAPRLQMITRGSTRSVLRYDEQDGGLTWIYQRSHGGRAQIHLRNDELGRVVEVWRQPDAAEWTRIVGYTYDAQGCLSRWMDPVDNSSLYAYDEAKRMVRLVDRNGFVFHYGYDATGRCVAGEGDDGVWRVALEYEPGWTRVTEGDGGVWTYEYNELGTITRIVDPYDGVTSRVLDAAGLVVEVVDAGGHSMKWMYDESGYHTGRIDTFGNEFPPEDEDPDPPNPLDSDVPETLEELEWGSIATRLRPRQDFRLPDTIAALASEMHRAESAAPARAAAPAVVRDALGRAIAKTDASGRTEAFAYDREGYLEAYRDGDGRHYGYSRASWRSRGSETDPQGNTTVFEHTAREQIHRIVDANANDHRYVYDLKDRITGVMRNGDVLESYAYDVGDRLIEKRDQEGRILLTFEVGANGLHSGLSLASGESYAYAYDERGNFVEASTDQAAVVLAFDELRRPLLDERDGLGVAHRYEAHGLASTVCFGRFEVTFEPAPDDSLLVRTPVGGPHRIRLLEDGSVLRELGNGSSELSRYDAYGRCCARVAWSREATSEERWTRYDYTSEGELRRAEDHSGAVVEWEYDRAHRLVGERPVAARGRELRYDPAGNIVSDGADDHFQYTSANRLARGKGETFRYDQRDNLVERSSLDGRNTAYSYDSLDMLVRVRTAGKSDCTFEYDGLCRRTAKRVGSAATTYYWDDDRLAAEIHADGRTRLYVYVDERAFVPFLFIEYDSIDAEPENGRAYYVFHDQIGAPVRIEDQRGNVVWLASRVDPYGEITLAPGNTLAYFPRFPGHYLDPETGLHYNRFRYYSPSLRRYLQPDPLGHAGGINLYAYPANPLAEVDVLGLHKHSPAAKSSGKGNGKAGARSKKPKSKRQKPLKDMSDEELQQYSRKRARQISNQLDPETAKRTTVAVTVIQKKGKPNTRRVIVSSSTSDGRLPKNRNGDNVRLKKGEEVVTTGPNLGRRDQKTPTGKKKIKDGKPVRESYDRDTGETYERRTRDNPDGQSDHHGEQRAKESLESDEEVAGMSHNRAKCCDGCTEALGDDISKVPTDQHGALCVCPACR